MNGLLTVFRKEVLDNLRDRRTLLTMAASIVLMPVLMFGLLWFVSSKVKEETDVVSAKAIELPVVGAELAPNLMNWLRQNNIDIVAPPDNPEQSVRDGTHRVVLIIESEFVDAFVDGKPAPLRLIRDSSSSNLKSIGFSKVRELLRGYSRQVGALRLQARGIDPQVIRPIVVNVSDVARPSARGAEILSMLPYMIIIFIMFGGLYLAIDTTAGEREHGSLEPLLAQPVPRHSLVLAKLAATCVFSAITLLFMLIGLAVGMHFAPLEQIGMSTSMDAVKVLKIFLGCLPFVLAGSALLIVVASFTKSYKEAQSYLSMVMLVPSLPLIFSAILSPKPELSNMWVPSLSQSLIINETIKGEPIAPLLIAESAIVTTILGLVLAAVAVKLYQRERILG